MALTINTNVMSMNAQRNLQASQSQLATSLQRLSSGLRINSAKDDAAGLAISERFTTQIRGLTQAARNANDGISLAQTTEGALGELTNNLQRIRELAVQSANSTNSSADRAALDAEVQQRLAEIDRIAQQTSFNGQKVLDGTFGTAAFQVGANVGETISINLSSSVRTTAIGKTADYVNLTTQYSSATAVGQQGTGVDGSALLSGDVKIALGSGQATTVVASVAGGGAGQSINSAYAKAAAINSSGIGGLTATADTTTDLDFVTVATAQYSMSVNGVAIFTNYDGTTTNLTGTAFAAAINANSSASGVSASFDSATNRITLSAADGRDIAVSQTAGVAGTLGKGLTATNGNNNTTNDAFTALTTVAGTAVTNTFRGSIRLTAADTVTISGTTPARIGFGAGGSLALGNSALNAASVTTASNANTTITRVDAALSSVSTLRSSLGAIQSRFESTISNLQATTENLSASRSRILDADFAQETANMTRAQVLQQAGVAILAQANAAPQSVLALLR
ncbi:MAG: flagellin [Pseudomonadota bacterium]